jgi:hypothetical protein
MIDIRTMVVSCGLLLAILPLLACLALHLETHCAAKPSRTNKQTPDPGKLSPNYRRVLVILPFTDLGENDDGTIAPGLANDAMAKWAATYLDQARLDRTPFSLVLVQKSISDAWGVTNDGDFYKEIPVYQMHRHPGREEMTAARTLEALRGAFDRLAPQLPDEVHVIVHQDHKTRALADLHWLVPKNRVVLPEKLPRFPYERTGLGPKLKWFFREHLLAIPIECIERRLGSGVLRETLRLEKIP